MNSIENTGFLDKQGKAIHVGDIVQIGLGPSSRERKRVIRTGKRVRLVNADAHQPGMQTGYILDQRIANLAVIIDHHHTINVA